jgi:hypothetical protein
VPDNLKPLLGVLLIIALTAWWVVLFLRMLRSRKGRRVALHGLRAERGAEKWLRGLGYQILGKQIASQLELYVNGQPWIFPLRADYLLGVGNKRYIAEVKSGKEMTSVSHAATRRQLLEYHLAYQVDGVLLVDAENKKVQHVELFSQAPPAKTRWIFAFVLGAMIGALAIAILLKY